MAVVINELLCYVLNKIDSVPVDTLTRLVSENFPEDETETAKNLLSIHVEDSLKAGKRRGQNKKKLDLEEIVKMVVECDRTSLPSFVALKLSKLPPISVDCIDVSAMMRRQQVMEVEMSSMKDMMDDILKITVETAKKVETAKTVPVVSVPGMSEGHGGEELAEGGGEPTPSASPTAATYAKVAASAIAGPSGAVKPARVDAAEEGWNMANGAKRGKPPVRKPPQARSNKGNSTAVIGVRQTGPIKAVAAVKRLSVFMSRLPPGTGTEAVQEYVKEQTGAAEVTATKLTTRYDTYESYRLDVINPSASNVLDPELWASGLIVRRFFEKRNNEGRTSSTAYQGGENGA